MGLYEQDTPQNHGVDSTKPFESHNMTTPQTRRSSDDQYTDDEQSISETLNVNKDADIVYYEEDDEEDGDIDDAQKPLFKPKCTVNNASLKSLTSSSETTGYKSRIATSYVGRTVIANQGLLLVAISQAFFAVMNTSVKILSSYPKPIPTFELVALRMLLTGLGAIAWMHYRKIPNPVFGPPKVRYLLMTRGFIGFFGLTPLYFSLRYLSLSDATVITFLAPIVTGILGFFLLKEPFTRTEAFAGLLSLLGIVLIARPASLFGNHGTIKDGTGSNSTLIISSNATSNTDPLTSSLDSVTTEQRLVATGVALIGVFGAAGAYITIRKIGKRAHALHSIAYFSAMCVIVATVATAALRIPLVFPPDLRGWLLFFAIGIFGFFAQLLLTMGLQREKAGRGTVAVYVQIIFAMILERIVFGRLPEFLSVIGTTMILGGAVWVAITKMKNKEPVRAGGEEIVMQNRTLAESNA